MRRSFYVVLCLAGGLLGVILAGRLLRGATSGSGPPTLEQIRELADLIVIKKRVSGYQHQCVQGYLGGLDLSLAVSGEVAVGCDLEVARLERLDAVNRTLRLVLPPPRVLAAYLDHSQTRVIVLERRGLWPLVVGSAGEATLVERSLARAQDSLLESAVDSALIERAERRAEAVADDLSRRLGWRITIVWSPDRLPP